MFVTRVEQQTISKTHPFYKTIDKMCFMAKNLYNYANYTIRQEFITNRRYIPYKELNSNLKHCDDYKNCMSQPANCVLRRLDKAWKSYFVAIKNWSKNPSKYLGKPKLPKYKDKNGRYVWEIPNNSCYFDENNNLCFRLRMLQSKGYVWKTHATGRLIQVRFVPRGSIYVMEIVTEIEVPDESTKEPERIAAIDLGVNNLVTLTNNIGVFPIIINGKGIKAINQYYNKQRAKLQSDLKLRNNQHWSNRLDTLNRKRFNRIKNFMHNTSRYIINWCIENNIDTIVVGKNDEWKQNTDMCKSANQSFVAIPYEMLIQQLEYKAQECGISVIQTEESYTSGTSFLDGELPCKENYDKSRRIKRGLFQAHKTLINSDVNGSLQIMRKVFPDAFSYGIVGNLTPLVINAV